MWEMIGRRTSNDKLTSVRQVDWISFHLTVRSVTRILEIARHALPFGSVTARPIWRPSKFAGRRDAISRLAPSLHLHGEGFSRLEAYLARVPDNCQVNRIRTASLDRHWPRLPRRCEVTRMSGHDGASATRDSSERATMT